MSSEEMEKLDREWESERQRYLVKRKYGRPYVPSTGAAVVVGLFSVSLGLMWIMASLALAPSLGAVAGTVPLFGLVFVVGGVAISYYQFRKAARYRLAYRAYQQRRAAVQENERNEPAH